MSLVTRKAPDFSIDAVVGDGDFKNVSLADYKGKYVVLFFYPADFTFICPTEIQEFSRRHEEFSAANCEVLGVSTDSKHSHKAWIKNGLGKLNHPLLADFNKTISQRLRGADRRRRRLPRDHHHRSERRRSARVVQRRPARPLGQRDAPPRAGAADRRALPGGVEAGTEDARQAGVAASRRQHRGVATSVQSGTLKRFRPVISLGARERLFSRVVRLLAFRAGLVLMASALAACDVPRPPSPRLWTLFDVQALYAAGADGTHAIATDAGLPGGVAIWQHARPRRSQRVDGAARIRRGVPGRVRDDGGLGVLRRSGPADVRPRHELVGR